MVQTKGQIIENSNLLFRLHHQRFYPKEFKNTNGTFSNMVLLPVLWTDEANYLL